MLLDEIAEFRNLGRPNRGAYTSGPLVGQPLPPHPLRFVDLPDPPSAGVPSHCAPVGRFFGQAPMGAQPRRSARAVRHARVAAM
jgi:hypothetical protein